MNIIQLLRTEWGQYPKYTVKLTSRLSITQLTFPGYLVDEQSDILVGLLRLIASRQEEPARLRTPDDFHNSRKQQRFLACCNEDGGQHCFACMYSDFDQ